MNTKCGIVLSVDIVLWTDSLQFLKGSFTFCDTISQFDPKRAYFPSLILRLVASCCCHSVLDAAQAMLDADEKQFEEDHKFSEVCLNPDSEIGLRVNS